MIDLSTYDSQGNKYAGDEALRVLRTGVYFKEKPLTKQEKYQSRIDKLIGEWFFENRH